MESITIKDIARMAGVSCATVSRAINGASGVEAGTRERILTLCRQHGYRRNLLARSLSARKTGLIGCILPDLNNPLFAELSLLLEQAVRQRGCHLLLCHGLAEDPDISQVFDYLIGHRVDGILLVSSSRQAPPLLQRYMSRVPVLLLGSPAPESISHPSIPAVTVDDLAGGRMAAEYLHSLGHRCIVYVGLRSLNYSHVLRHRGFLDTARALGISVRTLTNDSGLSNIMAGYHLARQLFFDGFQETAIAAACDTVALGVLSAAAEFHISIPEDLSLLGFDNISYAALPNIRLTTLSQPSADIAEAAVHSLLSQAAQPAMQQVPPILLSPSLLPRSTCRRL